MSECNRYEFRQPVEVFLDGEWHKAVYDAHDPGSSFCHLVRWYAPGDKESRAKYLFGGIVRPDPNFALVPTATPRTGWRLPEPGDVVTLRGDLRAREVIAVHWDNQRPILLDGDNTQERVRFNLYELELVRLHDAPQPEPFFKPGEDITASKLNAILRMPPRSNKQDIIDNAKLEMAAVTLEQDGHDHVAAMLRDLKRDWGV